MSAVQSVSVRSVSNATVLRDLADALAEPGSVNRGFADHLLDQIERTLRVAGMPTRGGSADERLTAVAPLDAAEESAAL